jgi:hypothetical protein
MPEAIATEMGPRVVEQDLRADSLAAKTVFASEVMASNQAWIEKEVSFILTFNFHSFITT